MSRYLLHGDDAFLCSVSRNVRQHMRAHGWCNLEVYDRKGNQICGGFKGADEFIYVFTNKDVKRDSIQTKIRHSIISNLEYSYSNHYWIKNPTFNPYSMAMLLVKEYGLQGSYHMLYKFMSSIDDKGYCTEEELSIMIEEVFKRLWDN